jgi:pyroglutamyl-peptidase
VPVVQTVPTLLTPPLESGLAKPDLVLHIGLAAGREFFTLERLSVGGSYAEIPDVDGNLLPSELRDLLFKDCPKVLRPTFDTKDLWRRWRDNVTDPKADLRPSDDPGQFLCGFIYYLSMAHFYRMGKDVERPVMFLHVPNLQSESEINQGREVAIGLLRALVASRQKLGKRDPLESGEYIWDEKIDSEWSGVRA